MTEKIKSYRSMQADAGLAQAEQHHKRVMVEPSNVKFKLHKNYTPDLVTVD